MEYRIMLTVDTNDVSQGAWPDESVEVGAVVSVLTEAGDEILGRVVGSRWREIKYQ
jgi:hypothetical protein